MTGNNELDVFILGIIFGFGLFLCVDQLTQKRNKAEKIEFPRPPTRKNAINKP